MGLVNEIGKVYGKLTVIERAPNDKAGRAYWLCQCECGNKTVVRGTSLRAGVVHSCGCLQKETAKANGNNLIGQTFGRLTVLEQVKNRTAHRGKYWKCQCACGNITEVRGDYLTGGTTKSCGCLQKEKAGNNKINEIGNQYGLLTVIAPFPASSITGVLTASPVGGRKVPTVIGPSLYIVPGDLTLILLNRTLPLSGVTL